MLIILLGGKCGAAAACRTNLFGSVRSSRSHFVCLSVRPAQSAIKVSQVFLLFVSGFFWQTEPKILRLVYLFITGQHQHEGDVRVGGPGVWSPPSSSPAAALLNTVIFISSYVLS